MVYSAAVKAGLSDAEAQDVVQETILTVSRKIQEFQRFSMSPPPALKLVHEFALPAGASLNPVGVTDFSGDAVA
jgi:pyrroline-5-carboxylate reductase